MLTRSRKSVFWIPMHLIDPERPTEHSIFNVPAGKVLEIMLRGSPGDHAIAQVSGTISLGHPGNTLMSERQWKPDSPGDLIQQLEWSPNSCTRALLVVNAGGRARIWSQAIKGGANVARTCNGWNCEYEWRQEQSISTIWLELPPLYRWTSSSTAAKGSLEEKDLPHQARASARWLNFLCVCSVFWAGTVQFHWKQWRASFTKWFATKKGVLGAGTSGVFTGDAIISDSGSLLVAAAPVGNPSTVVVWEVTPWDLNTSGNSQQVGAKIGMGNIQSPLLTTSPSWPGFSPLAAYLFTWKEQSTPNTLVEKEECSGLLLHCAVVSNFSAYVSPATTSVAFDPSRAGSALITTVVEY